MAAAIKRAILKSAKPGDVDIKGIIFDMDGTLCLPQPWMFVAMREALGIVGQPIDLLTKIDSLSPEEQIKAKKDIEDIEEKAMIEMIPQPGLVDLFTFLTANKINKTICTRNLIKPVNHLLNKHLGEVQLNEPIITRDFLPTKPAPEPLLHIIKAWGLIPEQVLMVGDSADDMLSGMRAGCGVILIKHDNNRHLLKLYPQIDYEIEKLDEIVGLLENGLELTDKSEIQHL